MTDVHSRSMAAGYDPAILDQAHVAVVGLGALGQNLVQSLTLSGVGSLLLVDFDEFEDHNATRSPYYPTPAERRRLGLAKAPNVAEGALRGNTASAANVLFAASKIQSIGDAAIRWADVIVSAVDDVNTRAWLAERTRLMGKPVVEGGFAGDQFNLSAFSGHADEPCYRCVNRHRVSSASCTQYALAAERAQIVPAIQSAAATLGGFMAETVIELLHGATYDFGKRYYGSVRRKTLQTAILQVDSTCPGVHRPAAPLELAGLDEMPLSLGDLAVRVLAEYPSATLLLPEPFHQRFACTECGGTCQVNALESVWVASPKCADCGGPWQALAEGEPATVRALDLCHDLDDDELADLPPACVGLTTAGVLHLEFTEQESGIIELPGRIEDLVEIVKAVPPA